jgi:hypothetical protein
VHGAVRAADTPQLAVASPAAPVTHHTPGTATNGPSMPATGLNTMIGGAKQHVAPLLGRPAAFCVLS